MANDGNAAEASRGANSAAQALPDDLIVGVNGRQLALLARTEKFEPILELVAR